MNDGVRLLLIVSAAQRDCLLRNGIPGEMLIVSEPVPKINFDDLKAKVADAPRKTADRSWSRKSRWGKPWR